MTTVSYYMAYSSNLDQAKYTSLILARLLSSATKDREISLDDIRDLASLTFKPWYSHLNPALQDKDLVDLAKQNLLDNFESHKEGIDTDLQDVSLIRFTWTLQRVNLREQTRMLLTPGCICKSTRVHGPCQRSQHRPGSQGAPVPRKQRGLVVSHHGISAIINGLESLAQDGMWLANASLLMFSHLMNGQAGDSSSMSRENTLCSLSRGICNIELESIFAIWRHNWLTYDDLTSWRR